MNPGLAERARAFFKQLEERLSQVPGVPPLEEARAAVRDAATTPSYQQLPPALSAHLETVRARGGETAVDARLKALMCDLVATHPGPAAAEFTAPLRTELERIVAEAGSAEVLHTVGTDQTLKDLAVCTGRVHAGGAQLIEPHRGLSRGAVLRAGLLQATEFLQTLVRLGGHDRFLEIHTSNKTLHEFTPAGWDRCYQRAAALLEADPAARGLFGSSWFYDPVLTRLSPRLAYLRAVPASAGARFYELGPDADATRDALATSPTRRELARTGAYTPTRWLMLWPRAALLDWAAARRPYAEERSLTTAVQS